MFSPQIVERALARFPRHRATHAPTALEPLPRLGASLGLDLTVKRDDCTGVAFGGNKVRQLEFYIGAAEARGADTILITGAVQSNFVRTAAAMARRAGMDIHVQLEERVPDIDDTHRRNGNVLLDHLFGATIHSFPVGEDEDAADASLEAMADALRGEGRKPYIIGLAATTPPLGALGYVIGAMELVEQCGGELPCGSLPYDEIVVASGSAQTHCGILFGLRALGVPVPVRGICVRRAADIQEARVAKRLRDMAAMTGLDLTIPDSDVRCFHDSREKGYGQMSAATHDAILRTAREEGLLLDPVYTGKVMAGTITLNERGELAGPRILYWHTGGQPALFAYAGAFGVTSA